MASRLVYGNTSATRNDPVNDRLAAAIEAAAAAAGIDRVVVVSGGQEAEGEGGARTGSTRHDHGGAADVELYVGDRLLDFTNPQDQALYRQFVTAARNNGVTGIGAGSDYMGNTRIHVGFGDPAVWGGGGRSANAPGWLVEAYNAGDGGNAMAYADGDQRPSIGTALGAANAMGEGGQGGAPTGTGRPILDRFNAFLAARDRGEAPIAERIRDRIRAMNGGGPTPIMDGIVTFFQNMGLRSAAERGITPPAAQPQQRNVPSITRNPAPMPTPPRTITDPAEKAALQPRPTVGMGDDTIVPPPIAPAAPPPPVAPSIVPPPATPAPPPPVAAPAGAPPAAPPGLGGAVGQKGLIPTILQAIIPSLTAPQQGAPPPAPSLLPPQGQPQQPAPPPALRQNDPIAAGNIPRPMPSILPVPPDPAAPAIRNNAAPPIDVVTPRRSTAMPFGQPTPPRPGAQPLAPSGRLPLPQMTRPNRRTGEMSSLQRLMALVAGGV